MEILKGHSSRDYIAAILRVDAKQYTSPEDFARRNRYFFSPVKESDILTVVLDKYRDSDHELETISSAARRLNEVPSCEWTATNLKAKVDGIVGDLSKVKSRTTSPDAKRFEDFNMLKKEFLGWLRTAIMGGLPGPGMADTMALLQRDVTLQRLQEAKVLLEDFRTSKLEQKII